MPLNKGIVPVRNEFPALAIPVPHLAIDNRQGLAQELRIPWHGNFQSLQDVMHGLIA